MYKYLNCGQDQSAVLERADGLRDTRSNKFKYFRKYIAVLGVWNAQ